MSSNPNDTVNTDPYGLWMAKPTKNGGQIWFIYNTDFNNDPQVITESVSSEYLVHNIEDADGTRFTISASDTFKAYISTSTGYNAAQNITDQQEMARRGYMQNTQDWRNVEITGQFVVFKEPTADDFITIGVRTGKHTGNGSPAGCTGCAYLFEVNMRAGGLVRIRKESWNVSIHNWLSALASGFDATKVCGWSFKVLCYNSQDANSVNVEMWIAKDNDNRFVKVLSGVDTGQLNTDATVCNCTAAGQPITWGGPLIMLQGNTGTFGFKNLSIREVEGFGATLPPVDPGTGGTGGGTGGTGGTGGGTGGGGTGTGGGGGTGSGTGGGGTGGGGGVPVDLTPVLATPITQYVKYGGGPMYNPLDYYVIFAGADWNKSPVNTLAGTTVTTVKDPILASPKSTSFFDEGGQVFTSATVHFIFWGSGWNTQTLPWSKNDVMAAIQKVFQSEYFSGLIQYGYSDSALNRKPKIGSIVTNTTYTPVNGFTLLDLRNVIVDSMNRGLVPDKGVLKAIAPGVPIDHHIYYVIGAHGCYPGSDIGSVASFHLFTDEPSDDEYIVYAYTNNMDYVSGNSTLMKYMTYGMTHEICEAITDPLLNGWVTDDGSGQLEELADVCSTEYNVNGVICSGYFSNEDNACIAPVALKPSWISCPTTYIYDPPTQTCTKTDVTPTPVPTPTPAPGTANPVFKAPKTNGMIWGGGPNTSLPMEVYFFFTGAAWSTNTTYKNNKATLKNQITAIFNSHYFEGLFQYHSGNGVGIPKPKLMGFYDLTNYEFRDGYGENEDVYPAAYEAIDSLLKLPRNTATKQNTFQVFLPTPDKSYVISGASGMHTAFADSDFAGGTRDDIYWYVFSLINTSHPFTEWIPTICHELAEAIADNYPFNGYRAATSGSPLDTSDGIEIADVCQGGASGFITPPGNSFQVAKYWSDYEGACISPYANAPGVPVTCPTGYQWDPVAQVCAKIIVPDPNPTPDPGTGGGGGGTTTPPPSVYSTANTTFQTKLKTDITAIFNSNYFNGAFQYGKAKRPNLKAFVVATTPPANTVRKGYTQDQENAFLDDCVAKKLVPVNTQTGPKNIAYLVIYPPHMESEDGSEGHHGAHMLSPSSITDPTKQWFYIKAEVTFTTTYEDFTDTITHELIESVTNHVAATDAGYTIKAGTPLDAKVSQYSNELADVCQTETRESLNGIFMAKYWSDEDGKCILPSSSTNPTPWLSCHTGAVFDNATQSCKLQPTPGGGGTTPPGTGGGQGYKVALANASDDDGHVPANAIDGKLDTRWSAFGKGQFLRLDLGTPKKVNKIKIAWYQGDKRTNTFEITTAANTGDAFISRFKGTSTKGSTALQDYPIPETTCRYIRIIGQGNSDNDWISISEAEVWGPDVASTTPGTGTGGDPGSGGTTPGGDTGGGTGTPHPAPDTPVTEAGYNFFDTSFSVDYHKIGLCNPVE